MKTENKSLARNLRKNSTWAERELWRHLRNRKTGGAKFRRQQCFGPYVLDFYCAEAGLSIELDGGQHDEPSHRSHDAARETFLLAQGIRTVRFWNSQIRQDLPIVLERIRMELSNVTPSPRPSPLKGEGEAEP